MSLFARRVTARYKFTTHPGDLEFEYTVNHLLLPRYDPCSPASARMNFHYLASSHRWNVATYYSWIFNLRVLSQKGAGAGQQVNTYRTKTMDMFLITHTVDRGQHAVLTAAAAAVPDGNWQPATSVDLDPATVLGSLTTLDQKYKNNTWKFAFRLNIKYF